MSASDPEAPAAARPTVFLSYASEDRRAAQLIRDALPAFGLEVWYDESDLVGGDAWDQKIRRQIRECDYFMPVISAHTEARHEGYFRREWRLAVERTLDMADDHVFLLPVVIDGTARPARAFRRSSARCSGCGFPTVDRLPRWRRCAGAWCRATSRHGQPSSAAPAARGAGAIARGRGRGRGAACPPSRARSRASESASCSRSSGWGLQSAWAAFKRLPRWLRIVIYMLARHPAPAALRRLGRITSRRPPRISATQAQKLRDIGGQPSRQLDRRRHHQAYRPDREGNPGRGRRRIVRLRPGARHSFRSAGGRRRGARSSPGSVFTQVYGRLAIARHGRVALADAAAARIGYVRRHAAGPRPATQLHRLGAVAGGAPGSSSLSKSSRWPTDRLPGRNPIPWQAPTRRHRRRSERQGSALGAEAGAEPANASAADHQGVDVGRPQLLADSGQLRITQRTDPHPVPGPRACHDPLHLRRDARAGQARADLVGLGATAVGAYLQHVGCSGTDGLRPPPARAAQPHATRARRRAGRAR